MNRQSLIDLELIIKKYRNDNSDISFTHGFITAVLSSPEMIMPHEICDYVLGVDEERSVEVDDVTVALFTDLFVKFYNDIAAQLDSGEYRPLLSLTKEREEWSYEDAKIWALGYLAGVFFYLEEDDVDEELNNLLVPFTILADYEDFLQRKGTAGRLSKSVKTKVLKMCFEDLPEVVLDINEHNRALEREGQQLTDDFEGYPGMNYANPEQIIHHDKIGRNDSCPCGSGKKYKKCCGR